MQLQSRRKKRKSVPVHCDRHFSDIVILWNLIHDIQHELFNNGSQCTGTEDYVEKKGGPLIEMRGVAALPEQEANA